mmetsp:Transcript_82379/g.266795  ORF Transcript_82379/g.266795 Transcript_82379/m.266795 type:complete len:207 (+) Transcript_82379:1458-2078(+)
MLLFSCSKYAQPSCPELLKQRNLRELQVGSLSLQIKNLQLQDSAFFAVRYKGCMVQIPMQVQGLRPQLVQEVLELFGGIDLTSQMLRTGTGFVQNFCRQGVCDSACLLHRGQLTSEALLPEQGQASLRLDFISLRPDFMKLGMQFNLTKIYELQCIPDELVRLPQLLEARPGESRTIAPEVPQCCRSNCSSLILQSHNSVFCISAP